MSTPTIERTGDWDSVPFAGGYAGLRDLADDDFSGMVTTGPTRLFMLRGSVVGILDGDIEDFAEGGGTAREAPHPALPLLAVMQERSDEVRAKYYTEETPLSEVDRTLADGNFTGYIELAENVLSGDYYQVYHQGRSMSVAYVGASERLITDDDAFEQADDEVGIYEVRPVDVEIIEIPEPDDDGGGGDVAASAGTTESGVDATTETTDDLGASAVTDADDASDADASTTDESAPTEDTTATAADAGVGTDSGTSTPATETQTAASDASTSTSETSATTSDAVPAEESTSTTDDSAVADTDSTDTTEASDAEPSAGDATTTSTTDEPATSESSTSDAATETSSNAGNDGTGSTAEADSQSAETGASESAAAETSTESSTTDSANTAPSTASGSTADAAASRSSDAAGGGAAPTQQGQPAPDHPAAAGRDRSGESAGNGSSADRPAGSIGAGDLEVRSLPSLDPSRTASASRQERERRSGQTAGGAVATSNAQRSEPAQSAGQGHQQGGAGTGGDAAGGAAEGPAPAGQSTQAAGEAATGQGATDANATDVNATDANATDANSGHANAAESGTAEQPASEPADSAETDPDGSASEPEAAGGGSSEELEDARAEAQRLESELADLRGDHEAVVEERDRLEAELAEAREEIDRLRVRLEDAADQGTEASQKLSPRQAIDETNLFIRYDSKGEATLEKAHAGDVDKSAVDANMRLEYHTSFDANDAAVDGVDFDSFLTDTVQYRFVDWLVRKLLYEIRDTDNTGPMGELYDALPQVDRAELNGQVGVQYTENGEEHRAQVGFDVIVRDRMGNPLIVANLNDSRDPATDSMMTDLVRAAERVGESSSSLAGAFLVTRSFFEPEALETAEEATAGGLLNRGKQKSFVNLSRKGGYHLCLVEARNQEFHLAVPEL